MHDDQGAIYWAGEDPPPMDAYPIGTIIQSIHSGIHWIKSDTGPLKLEGGWVSVDQFPKLHEVLREIWGEARPDGTFQLPDMRSRSLWAYE